MERKIPEDLVSPVWIKISSCSCYPVKESKNIIYYAGENNNNTNRMKLKSIKTKWGKEIELVIVGNYHKEIKQYAVSDDWASWIRIDIPFSELDGLIGFLQKLKNIEVMKRKEVNHYF